METTEHFNKINATTKDNIRNIANNNGGGYKLEFLNPFECNRAQVFELVGENVIFKKFEPKGKEDSDIAALKDLDGIDYFPKLYAYEDREYLFMEKAEGVNLPTYLASKPPKKEVGLIKEKMVDAFTQMLSRNRRDWDFKLEHFFWSPKNQRLMWIDMSICDVFAQEEKVKQDEIECFANSLENEFRFSGFNY